MSTDQGTTATVPATAEPGDGGRARAVLLITSGATFTAFLDTTVVNVAFPQLHGDFPEVSIASLTWVVTSYTVLFAALLASAGRFADALGRRRTFLWSVGLFTLASAIATVAPRFEVLVAARALQGIGAAGMIPSALALLLVETPPARRMPAVGAWAAAGSIAALVGPALSGFALEVSWRLIFLVNIPIGLAMLAGTIRVVRPDVPAPDRRSPDLLGSVLLALGVGAVVFGLTETGGQGWGPALGAVACGMVAVAAALQRSRRHASPAVDLTLLANRRATLTNLAAAVFGIAIFPWLLVAPLFLTEVWDYSIMQAALAITPGAATSILAARFAGGRRSLSAQRTVIVAGVLLQAAVSLALYTFVTTTPAFLSLWLTITLLGGIAAGAVLTTLSGVNAGSVAPQRFAAATGMLMASRQIGGSLGIAAMALLLGRHDVASLSGYREVFLFCAVAAAAAVIPALFLSEAVGAPGPR